MDEQLRRLERAARDGDREAATRLHGALSRVGRPGPSLPVDERVRLGLFDTFTTRLRDDIVEAARETAEEGARFNDDGVCLEPAWCPVDLLVNGERLEYLLGDYGSQLPAHTVYLPTPHLLGGPYEWPSGWAMRDEDGKTLLAHCCSWCEQRLVATITVLDETVTWTDLEERPNQRSPGRYADMAFVFRRADYEAALRDPPP